MRSSSGAEAGSTRQGERLRAAPRLLLERRRAALDHAGARLQALSPLATLGRGYAIVRANAEAVRERGSRRTAGERGRDPARDGLAGRNVDERCGRERVRERSFEELQRELEEIVSRLERGDVPVDEAIGLFRRGEELYKACVSSACRASSSEIEELAPRRSGYVTRGTRFVYESPHGEADSSAPS